MYYVIFYEDWCSTIPQDWIDFENKVHVWPPKEITKAIRKNISPKNYWFTRNCECILGPFQNYELSRQVETSMSLMDNEQMKKVKENLPPSPQKRRLFYDESDESTSDENVNKNVNNMANKSEDESETLNHDRHHTCCDKCQKNQKTLIRKLDFLINLIENKYLENPSEECDSKLLPAFPLVTLEDFSQFEKELQEDREIRKQFKAKIVKIGGKTFADKTRNVLKFIMNDNIAKKMSWTDRFKRFYCNKKYCICKCHNRLYYQY